MRKFLGIIVSSFIIVCGLWVLDTAVAAPYPTGVGGTGTSQTPASGTIPIGTGSGTYTPAYLLCTGNCSVSSASGTVTVNVPAQSTSTLTIYPVSAATSSFSIVGDGSYIAITNPATSTIKVSLSTAQVLQLLSAASPLAYNSSTGQFSCASCLTSLNGALLVANNLSDVASTTAARSNLGLGSIATYSKTDYLTSSTVYVWSVNGSSGAVTITSSTLGVISRSSFSASGTGLTYNSSTGVFTWANPGYITTTTPTTFATSTATNTFKWTVVGLSATLTIPSNVSYFTNDAGYLATNTGNWAGTWQGVNSSTFYLASNPSSYVSTVSTTAPLTGNGVGTPIGCASCITSNAGNWAGTWQGANSTTFYLASNPSGYISGNQTITWTGSGDVTGTASGATSLSPTLHVVALQGYSVSSTAPATGTVLEWNGSSWIPLATSSLGLQPAGSYITLTSISASTPIAYNNTTGAFSWTGVTTSTNETTGQLAVWTSSSALGSTSTYVQSLGGATGTIACGAYVSCGSTLTVSSTLASSSASFVLTNPTTTSPYNLSSVYTNTKKNLVYVDCWEAASAATTTIELFYNTTLASTSMQQVILSSLACTNKGTSTATFTTSTIPIGAYLFADVSSTAGTPTQTTVDISATKL